MKYLVLPDDGSDKFENYIDIAKFEGQIPEGAFMAVGSDEIQVGDIVACRKGHNLELGWDGLNRPKELQENDLYEWGICVSLNPFVIISQDGIGIWRKKNPDHYFSMDIKNCICNKTALETWRELNEQQ